MDPPASQRTLLNYRLSSHPLTLLTLLAVRLLPLILYLLGLLLLTSSFILVFILVLLLLAADFYYLKNIAGRRLVGLRWWNEAVPLSSTSTTSTSTSTGGATSKWVFEAPDPSNLLQTRPNATDTRSFWLLLYGVPLLWMGLAFVAVLKFELIWLSLVGVAVGLGGTNALAFSRCDQFGKAGEMMAGAGGVVGGVGVLGGVAASTVSRFLGR